MVLDKIQRSLIKGLAACVLCVLVGISPRVPACSAESRYPDLHVGVDTIDGALLRTMNAGLTDVLAHFSESSQPAATAQSPHAAFKRNAFKFDLPPEWMSLCTSIWFRLGYLVLSFAIVIGMGLLAGRVSFILYLLLSVGASFALMFSIKPDGSFIGLWDRFFFALLIFPLGFVGGVIGSFLSRITKPSAIFTSGGFVDHMKQVIAMHLFWGMVPQTTGLIGGLAVGFILFSPILSTYAVEDRPSTVSPEQGQPKPILRSARLSKEGGAETHKRPSDPQESALSGAPRAGSLPGNPQVPRNDRFDTTSGFPEPKHEQPHDGRNSSNNQLGTGRVMNGGNDDIERQARQFPTFINSIWSAANGDIEATLSDMYADPVMFYGKSVPRAKVLEDKKNYFARWDQSQNIVKTDTINANCDANICKVTFLVDWQVFSSQKNKRASGTAMSFYEIEIVNGSYRILSEDGKVISRD